MSTTTSGFNSRAILRVVVVVLVLVFIAVLVVGLFGKLRGGQKLSESYASKGKTAVESGDYSQAAEYYKKAVNAEPSNTSYLKELAISYYNSKDYSKAIATYQEIIKLDANNAFAYNGMANAYRDWADTSADKKEEYQALAKENYQNAILANKQFTVAYNNLALLLQDMGKKDEAVKVLEEGVKANPDSDELKQSLEIMKK